MPRNPVLSSVPALQPCSEEGVKRMMLSTADEKVSKERLLSTAHGVVQDFRPDDDCDRDSDAMSDPATWEGNTARKTLDMQWHFTCGPLRVARHTGKDHWNRLHASSTTVIPQPGGGVHVLRSSIPHRSDRAITAAVDGSGIAKGAAKRASPSLPSVAQTEKAPTTPVLRERLLKSLAPQVPKPLRSSDSAFTDGSSVFSRTTVASRLPPASVASKATRTSAQVAGSAVASNAGAPSDTSSKASAAASLAASLSSERSKKRDVVRELKDAAERLAVLESILSSRETSM